MMSYEMHMTLNMHDYSMRWAHLCLPPGREVFTRQVMLEYIIARTTKLWVQLKNDFD